MWTINFYLSFFKNILLYRSSRLSKIRSVHTYAMPWTVFNGRICKPLSIISCSRIEAALKIAKKNKTAAFISDFTVFKTIILFIEIIKAIIFSHGCLFQGSLYPDQVCHVCAKDLCDGNNEEVQVNSTLMIYYIASSRRPCQLRKALLCCQIFKDSLVHICSAEAVLVFSKI